MDRFPVVITFGAALLGYVAGEMIVDDPGISPFLEANLPNANILLPLFGAIFVIAAGKVIEARHKARALPEAE